MEHKKTKSVKRTEQANQCSQQRWIKK